MAASIPLFDAKQPLPGGPWRSYQLKTVVWALRVPYAFDFKDSNGKTTTYADGWLVQDSTGAISAVGATEFAAQYQLAE